jgi:hypothetical protein
MMKLLLAATMALGLGMGAAFAATTSDHANWPTVIHNGPPSGSPSYAAGGAY